MNAELISPEYLKQNAELHCSRPDYGIRGDRHREALLRLAKAHGATSILDYGCGKGKLAKAMADDGISVQSYDPAIPEFSAPPDLCDIVLCADVLEHVEPEKLDAVLTDIRRLARKAVYFVVATNQDFAKTLPDGRHPHLIVQSAKSWRQTLELHFPDVKLRGITKNDATFTAAIPALQFACSE